MSELRTSFDNLPDAREAHKSDTLALHRFANTMGLIQDAPTDGVTDASAIIQHHIDTDDAAWLMPGNYRLANPLRITKNTFRWFRGMGGGIFIGAGQGTILKPDSGINAIEIEVRNTYSNPMLFSDFSTFGGLNGIYSLPTPYQSLGWRFENLSFKNHTVAGINLNNSIYNGLFTNITTINGQYGIRLYGTQNISGDMFIQCNLGAYSVGGLWIDGTAVGANSNITILGGLFQPGVGEGTISINLLNMSNVSIINPYIEGGPIGINIDGLQAPQYGSFKVWIDNPIFANIQDVAVQIAGHTDQVDLTRFCSFGFGVRWKGVIKFKDSSTRNIYSIPTMYVDDFGNQRP